MKRYTSVQTIALATLFGGSLLGPTATEAGVTSAPHVATVRTSDSNVWSGYVAHGYSVYTAAGAEWKVPAALKCDRSGEGRVSIWVGVGGTPVNDPNHKDSTLLVQAGIVDDCKLGLFAFYEIEDQDHAVQPVDTAKYPVKPGDSISVDLFRDFTSSDTAYHYEIGNATQNWVFNLTETVSPLILPVLAPDSAEWIVENAPRGANIDPLPNFGSVTLDHCDASTAAIDDVTLSADPKLIKVRLNTQDALPGGKNNNKASAIPGAPATATVDGAPETAFSVTWKAPPKKK